MTRSSYTSTLRNVDLFAECSNAEIDELSRFFTPIDVSEDRILVEQGKPGYEFFVLIDGAVEVQRNGNAIASLEGGSWFGEMALLNTSPRTATVLTRAPSRVLVASRTEFRDVLRAHPSIGERLRDVAATRTAELVAV